MASRAPTHRRRSRGARRCRSTGSVGSNIPLALLLELTDGAEDPASLLQSRYGARPKDQFVQNKWPLLRDLWLANDDAVRDNVVACLVAAGLGDGAPDPDAASQMAYLSGLRNAKTLRTIVLEAFHQYGEEPHEAPAAEPPGDELDLVQRPWVTAELDDPAAAAQLATMVLDEIQSQFQMDDEWVEREPTRLRWWGGPIPLTVDASAARSVFGDPTVKVVIEVTLATDVTGRPQRGPRDAWTTSTIWPALERSCGSKSRPRSERSPRSMPTLATCQRCGCCRWLRCSPTAKRSARSPTGSPTSWKVFRQSEPHPITGERSDFDEMLGFTDSYVIPKGAEPCAWNDDEFTSVLAFMEQMGFFANGGAGFAVEYPFTSSMPATVQAGLDTHPGGQTALYQQLTNSPHPGYGQGCSAGSSSRSATTRDGPSTHERTQQGRTTRLHGHTRLGCVVHRRASWRRQPRDVPSKPDAPPRPR